MQRDIAFTQISYLQVDEIKSKTSKESIFGSPLETFSTLKYHSNIIQMLLDIRLGNAACINSTTPESSAGYLRRMVWNHTQGQDANSSLSTKILVHQLPWISTAAQNGHVHLGWPLNINYYQSNLSLKLEELLVIIYMTSEICLLLFDFCNFPNEGVHFKDFLF